MKKVILAAIFSDVNFTQATNNFSSSQTIYVRINWQASGEKEKTLNQSGEFYTANFSAPDSSGIYYLDIRIDSGSGSKRW